jgi:hypothetical protein
MAGTMSRSDLVADLKVSLHDIASIFKAENDADFIRMLDASALDMGRVRPNTLLGSINLVADQDSYDAPVGMIDYKSTVWGMNAAQPWEAGYPGRLPRVVMATVAGVRKICFKPAPVAQQISALGAEYKFYYLAGHSIAEDAANTTIQPVDRGLLLIRAQAEACKEMSIRNINKSVQLRDGVSQGPRNGTPAYLFETLMNDFERMARC